MKKKLILMLLITLTLSFSSCGSKTPSEETKGVVETTVISESEATETESEATATPEAASKESVVYTPDPTPTMSESTVTAEEVTPYASIEDIPKDIYDPASTEPMENRYQKVEDAYTSGKITESQYRDLVLKILNGDGNSTSSSTTGSTGSSTSGDTYIPAHGNPGTPDTGVDTGYAHEDDPSGNWSNVTIN